MSEPSVVPGLQPDSNEVEEGLASEPSTAQQLLVEDDLVIEEVSIDGMCGVY
jgi:mycofactocin precursor